MPANPIGFRKLISPCRSVVIGIILTLSIAGCGTSRTSVRTKDGTDLEAGPSIVQLSEIPVGLDKGFSSVLTNSGLDKVRIDKVSGSCGCLALTAEKDECAPGETIRIAGVIRPRKPGPFRHLVTVLYRGQSADLSEQQQIIIEVTGSAYSSIEISPPRLVFAPSATVSSVLSTVKITNRSDRLIRLYQIDAIQHGISIKLEKSKIQPKEVLELTCRLQKHFYAEDQFAIRLMTSLPTEKVIEIPVEVKPKERIVITPSEIHLGVISRKQLLDKGKIRFAVTGIECESLAFLKAVMPTYIRFDRVNSIGDRAFDLVFDFIDRFPENDLSGRLEITVRGSDKTSGTGVEPLIGSCSFEGGTSHGSCSLT